MLSPPLTTCRVHDAPWSPGPAALRACTSRGPSQKCAWRSSLRRRAELAKPAPRAQLAPKQQEVVVAESKVVPAAPAAPAVVALSKTPKFKPWFRALEAELLEVAIEVVRSTTGERVESGAEDVDDEALEEEVALAQRKERLMGPAALEAEQRVGLEQLGGKLGKLMKLLQEDIMPKFSTDPEAFYLLAAAEFIARKYESALHQMQTALAATAEGHCSPRDLAARHYFLSLIAIKIMSESNENKNAPMEEAMPQKSTLPAARQAELCALIERSLSECLRLDPRHHSAYIDGEMLSVYRYANDPYELVASHARLVRGACATGRFWVDALQRPMHFYPKLRSQPWWDVADFPWVAKLLANYDQIRAEVLKMRQPASAESKGREWDAVGSKHDAGDRRLVENGPWTELVLLNRDEKVASL